MKRLLILCVLLVPTAAMADDKAIWEQTGVPMPEGLKFYRQTRASQRLSIVNEQHVHGLYAADQDLPDLFRGGVNRNTNKKPIWDAPGGLTWVPRDEWRNATAVAFPPGSKVQVYRTMTQVKNSFGSYQDNARLAWVFPEGTQFFDLLIRRHNGEEWPFELRQRVKVNGQWESTAYRPWSDESELPEGSRRREFAVSSFDDQIPARDSVAHAIQVVGKAGNVFKPSRLAVTSDKAGGFSPRHYIGNVVSCATCHDRAGESGNYAGVNAPGSDGVLSWRPFSDATLNTDAFPQLDTSWPVEYVGWRGRNTDHAGRPQR